MGGRVDGTLRGGLDGGAGGARFPGVVGDHYCMVGRGGLDWRMDFGGRVVPTLVELKWGPNQRRAGGY